MTRLCVRDARILILVVLCAATIAIFATFASFAQVGNANPSTHTSTGSSAPIRPLTPTTKGFAGNSSLDSGNPIFLPALTFATGVVSFVAVADVNGDGKPDLLSANLYGGDPFEDEGSVGVMLGNGDGTFQTVVNYPADGTGVSTLAVADLNGNGKRDVVIASRCVKGSNCSPGPAAVLLGNGDGTFQPAVAYDTGGYPQSIGIADIDGDGKLDLVVMNVYGSGVYGVGVLLGNGDGTFRPAIQSGSGGTLSSWINIADVNGDGKPDLVQGGVFVFIGNGDGTFQSAVHYDPGGTYGDSAAIADVNGDGILDVIAATPCDPKGNCNGHGTLGVMLGNGDGTFKNPVLYDVDGSEEGSVGAADINQDGKIDLITNGGVLLLGNGDGTFQPALTFSPGVKAGFMAIADVNGDSRPDVVLNANGVMATLINNTGPHTSTTTALISQENPASPRQKVTYVATVSSQSGIANGTVTFNDGGSAIGTVTVSANQAKFATTYKSEGVHSITATYSGDLHNSGSTSSVLTESIEGKSKTVVKGSPSPSYVGQSVTFTATITSPQGSIPDGETVTFYDKGAAIGTATTASGVATFTTAFLTAKIHIVMASYPGDSHFEPSSGTIHQVVKTDPTTTSLSSNPNPSTYGQSVTFTATVASSGPQPTGTVKFFDGKTRIGWRFR